MAQLVKNPPAMWETWVWSLLGRSPGKGERLSTPVFWPGEFHGLYSPWAHKESDTTEKVSLPGCKSKCHHLIAVWTWVALPRWWSGNPSASAGDAGSVPGLGRSPGEGNGNPLQYSCLENSMARGAWWATVHGVTQSWTWLSMHVFGGDS